ncbi:MAG: hypothetical protein K0R61_2034 [Microvirga sp.]|nr:hypothetical protein [Microvirga sp.]
MRTAFATVLLALATAPRAEASACYGTRDYDKRLACLADERRSPDARALCRQRAGESDPREAAAMAKNPDVMPSDPEELVPWMEATAAEHSTTQVRGGALRGDDRLDRGVPPTVTSTGCRRNRGSCDGEVARLEA